MNLEKQHHIGTDHPLEKLSKSEIKWRKKITEHLSRSLADTTIVYFTTLNYHWNIEGTTFYEMHKLLEEQYKDLAEGMDQLAERIRMLGETSPGSLTEFKNLTSITEFNTKKGVQFTQSEMIRNLISQHEKMNKTLIDSITCANEYDDFGTSDLLIKRLKVHEKSIWMLRSSICNSHITH